MKCAATRNMFGYPILDVGLSGDCNYSENDNTHNINDRPLCAMTEESKKRCVHHEHMDDFTAWAITVHEAKK